MRGMLLRAPGQFGAETLDTPRPGRGEGLVKVAATGVCVGDLHIYRGKNPYAHYPCVCGHEVTGTVVDAGDDVSLAANTLVAVEPFLGCGTCPTCRAGKSNCCPRLQILGVTKPGGFAEYLVAPASHLHAVPPTLSATTAALTEPVAIGVQACRRGQINAGDLVLVLGCGPIGLAAAEVARSRGARVLASDLSADRRASAAEVGAEVLPPGDALTKAVLDRTEGHGVPVIIEATGSPAVMAQTLDLVAHGGRIVILGLVKDGLPVSFAGLDLTRKEPTIVGSRASVGCFPEAMALLNGQKIHLAKLTTTRSLWDAPALFADMAAADPSAASLGKTILSVS